MGEVVDFPKPEKFTPPAKGYCSWCRHELDWPRLADGWPDSCPHCGATPFAITSYLPEPSAPWFLTGTS